MTVPTAIRGGRFRRMARSIRRLLQSAPLRKRELGESRKRATCGGFLLALAVIVAAILAILWRDDLTWRAASQ
jgi:hypothetical protein